MNNNLQSIIQTLNEESDEDDIAMVDDYFNDGANMHRKESSSSIRPENE